MRALIIGLLAALTIALGAALFWGGRLHGQLARMNADAELSRAANGDLETRLTTSDRARMAAEASLEVQRSQNIRRMFSAGDPNGAPEDVDRFNAAVEADPVWGPFFQKLEWRRVMSRYSILLSALKIPPDKLATLQKLLVDRAIETRRISRRQRVAANRPATPDFTGDDHATGDIDAKIETLIGSSAAQAIKEWNSAVYSYGIAPDGPVAQDAVTLNDAGFTVTNDQLVRLALIRYEVHTQNPEMQPGLGGPPLDPKTGLTSQDEKLLAREAEVLSPDEITVLRNWSAAEHKARAALEALRVKYHIVSDRGRVPGTP
jgi:hypothetical protein